MVVITCLLLAAVQSTQIVVVQPSNGEISLHRLGTAIGNPEYNHYIQYALLLTNNTDRDIVGIAVRWEPEGGTEYTVLSDSYGSTKRTPVVPAKGSVTLTPIGFLPLTDIETIGVRPEIFHREIDHAARVTINVDVVILDDGQVLGLDKSGLADSIDGRSVAIARISQVVQKAKNEGQDITAALRGLMPPPGSTYVPPDPVTNWVIFYAGELSRFPERRDARLRELQQLPKPPTFFRK
jgi:hypothetical protein